MADSGIPVKVGVALTARKTVAMSMRYANTEGDPVRQAAELVAKRRQTMVMGKQSMRATTGWVWPLEEIPWLVSMSAEGWIRVFDAAVSFAGRPRTHLRERQVLGIFGG